MAGIAPLRRVVLRGSLGVLILGASALLGAILLGDAVLRGAWSVGLVGTAAIATLLWLEWWWVVSPGLVVTREGVQVVSPLRLRTARWHEIREIRPRFVTTIVLEDGRRLRAFGAPTAGVDRAIGAGDLGVPSGQPASVLVTAARRHLEELGTGPRDRDVATGWRWREALVAVVLAGITALATLAT